MSLQQNIKIYLKLKTIVVFCLFLISILVTNHTFAQKNSFKVILDAGHGGKDSGTLGTKRYKKYESYIAFKVTTEIGKLLKTHTDITAIYTRNNNNKTFVPLHQRGKIANKANADLFISIHCNSASTNAYGTTTYVLGMGKTARNFELSKRENDVVLLEKDYKKNYKYDPRSSEFLIGLTLMQEEYQDKSIEFAQLVQRKFKTVAKRKDRGINQGNLAVLYDTYMPSVLIEIGFLTNKKEEDFLHTTTGQKKIAKAIYEAIISYKSRLQKNTVTTNTLRTETPTKQATTRNSETYYKVQFQSSPKKIALKSYNFKKLKNVEREKKGKIYKYLYGNTSSLSEAKKNRKKVVALGYKDAFIRTYKGTTTNHSTNTTKTHTPKTNISKSAKTKKGNYAGVAFKVQISSSTKKIETKSFNFKGLKNVERVKIGNHYKYYYGKTSNYNEIKKLRLEVIEKGYKGAWIVAIKNGKLVSVRDVLKGKE